MNDDWASFLNPEIVRRRFVKAGLFLIAHEMLISAIKDRLHEFFSDSWSSEDGWKPSPDYRHKVLALDPKKKEDPLRASIAWLREMNVLDMQDELTIKELTLERNRLAHELRSLVGGSRTFDFDILFPKIAGLVSKIDRWWVINLEIATDPDMIEKDIDEEGIIPGSAILLQILAEVALGQDEKAWELYNEFAAKQRSPT